MGGIVPFVSCLTGVHAKQGIASPTSQGPEAITLGNCPFFLDFFLGCQDSRFLPSMPDKESKEDAPFTGYAIRGNSVITNYQLLKTAGFSSLIC